MEIDLRVLEGTTVSNAVCLVCVCVRERTMFSQPGRDHVEIEIVL